MTATRTAGSAPCSSGWPSMLRAVAFGLALLAAASCAAAQAPSGAAGASATATFEAPGAYSVETIRGVWRDAARDRDVPYLVRYPANAQGRRAIVLFSHGLGGTENGAAYFGKHLASHGFIVAHLRHQGSDAAIWGGERPNLSALDPQSLRRVVADPRVTIERFRDIPFAVTSLADLDRAPGPLQGRLALDRIGMSGHSFGAVTTQAAAGQAFNGRPSFRADGVRAFLAMSPSGPRTGDAATAFNAIDRPFMFMTGTQDSFGVGQGGPEAVLAGRRAPFDAIRGPPTYLITLEGADHFVFSGREETGARRPDDARDQAIIVAAATAFFSAYLLDDANARAWLDTYGLTAYAGADARIEMRGAP